MNTHTTRRKQRSKENKNELKLTQTQYHLHTQKDKTYMERGKHIFKQGNKQKHLQTH